MNEEQKKARLDKWQETESPFYRRWRVYSTFFTGFAIGLFYVLLISGKIFPGIDAEGQYAIVLIFSGILGGVIYTIMIDGHVEMPQFIEDRADRFSAGLFGDILLGIAGAIILDVMVKKLIGDDTLAPGVEVAAAGIVGGYGGRAILQFALQRVFKDINLLEADREAYLKANLQQRLERVDSLTLIDLVNQQIKLGLASSELNELSTEIEKADSGVQKRVFNLVQDFRLAAKAAGDSDRIQRMIPIFEALIRGNANQHAYYAELAFAYKDSSSPDLFQAIQYLDKAIAIRGNQQRAQTWNYELSRAITRIEVAYQETESYDFDPAVHERIIADLLSVAEIYNLENILKAVSDQNLPVPVMDWMYHNQTMLAAHPKAKFLLEQLDSRLVEEPAPQPEIESPSKPPTPPSNLTPPSKEVLPPMVRQAIPEDTLPAAGIELIKEFEGYAKELPDGRARAYADAIHDWDVPTIGYGTTRYPDGKKVQKGDVITRAEAEKYLLAEVEHSCKHKLEAIPTWSRMNSNQRAALYSFAYNLGASFYRGQDFASITRVCDSPAKWTDKAWVEAQLVKYRNPGTPAEIGLRRRRVAEAKLFCTPVVAQSQFPEQPRQETQPQKSGKGLTLIGSVGSGGQNSSSDVLAVKQRLEQLGFGFFSVNDRKDQGLVDAIRLFQSIIHGKTTRSGDGRIDVNGRTHTFLKASNAPMWIELPIEGEGFINYERKFQPNDDHDYGVSWISEVIESVGKHYERNYRHKNKNVALVAINDVSRPEGGWTPDHAGHECGNACDLLLPHKGGKFGGVKWHSDKYDQAATRAQLQALKAQSMVSNIYFNDPQLKNEGLCAHSGGHDDHIHFEIRALEPQV